MFSIYRIIAVLFIASVLGVSGVSSQDVQSFSSSLPVSRTSYALMKSVQASAAYRPTQRITRYREGARWIDESRTRNKYAAGRLTGRALEQSFGEGWERSEMYEYSYASDGTLTDETTYWWGGLAWVPSSRTLYDSQNGVFTQILEQIPTDDGSWVTIERTNYTLTNGVITAGQTDIWSGSWSPYERFFLEQQPNRVHETTQMHDGTRWVNVSRYTFAQVTIAELYDILTQLILDFEDYEGMYFTLLIPDNNEQYWDGGQWVDQYNQVTYREYLDGPDLLVLATATTQEWNGAGWVDVFRLQVEYSMDPGLVDVPTATYAQLFDGFVWQNLLVETYEHQADIGRIIRATLAADFGSGIQDVGRTDIQWINTTGTSVEDAPDVVTGFELTQNDPNPFNPSTSISYPLQRDMEIEMIIFNALGQEVRILVDTTLPTGAYTARWDGTDDGNRPVESGMYVYRLRSGDQTSTRTLILLR